MFLFYNILIMRKIPPPIRSQYCTNLIDLNMFNNDFCPKISVIVPCYNVEKYVEECLESIIHQTYDNLEIILVNDGSNDNTGSILDRYATKDDRIVVIHKPNGGLSSARNAGLDIMTGDLVSFIDSDDFVDIRLYQCVVSAWSKNINVDFVQFGYKPFEDGDVISASTDVPTFDIISREKAIGCHIILFKYNCVWGKIFKKDMFSNIRFMEGRIVEDLPVSLEAYYNSHKIININTYLYYYRVRQGSIMTSDHFRVYNSVVENTRCLAEGKYKNDKKFIKYAYNCVLSIFINDFIRYNRSLINDTDIEVISQKIRSIDAIKSIRFPFNYTFMLYPSFEFESLSLYIKAKLFLISPRLALFYDNFYLEFKLFVKKLLGKGIRH